MFDETPAAPGARPIDRTYWTQPAIFAVGYALAELWRSWGIEPAVLVGHSVGEFTAATVAGVFTLDDGVRLVLERARLMQSLPEGGGMLAVFAAEDAAIAAAAGEAAVGVAATNAPDETVLSGEGAALARVAARLEARGVRSKPLDRVARVSFAADGADRGRVRRGVRECDARPAAHADRVESHRTRRRRRDRDDGLLAEARDGAGTLSRKRRHPRLARADARTRARAGARAVRAGLARLERRARAVAAVASSAARPRAPDARRPRRALSGRRAGRLGGRRSRPSAPPRDAADLSVPPRSLLGRARHDGRLRRRRVASASRRPPARRRDERRHDRLADRSRRAARRVVARLPHRRRRATFGRGLSAARDRRRVRGAWRARARGPHRVHRRAGDRRRASSRPCRWSCPRSATRRPIAGSSRAPMARAPGRRSPRRACRAIAAGRRAPPRGRRSISASCSSTAARRRPAVITTVS